MHFMLLQVCGVLPGAPRTHALQLPCNGGATAAQAQQRPLERVVAEALHALHL